MWRRRGGMVIPHSPINLNHHNLITRATWRKPAPLRQLRLTPPPFSKKKRKNLKTTKSKTLFPGGGKFYKTFNISSLLQFKEASIASSYVLNVPISVLNLRTLNFCRPFFKVYTLIPLLNVFVFSLFPS